MSRPPRLATLLLRLGVHGGRRAEIEDDLLELYQRRRSARGRFHAARRYWHDVISFYVPGRGIGDAARRPSDRGAGPMATMWFDLRQMARLVRRQPVFFGVSTLTLAVGLAASFTAFGIVDRLLLAQPAHVREATRVFRLHVDRADDDGSRFIWWQTPFMSYQALRDHARGFAAWPPTAPAAPALASEPTRAR